MFFESVTEATKIWIKGRDFTVGKLLGEGFQDRAAKYENGSLAIFRLAPQDYHRYHCPVDGVCGYQQKIEGQYYTGELPWLNTHPRSTHAGLQCALRDSVRQIPAVLDTDLRLQEPDGHSRIYRCLWREREAGHANRVAQVQGDRHGLCRRHDGWLDHHDRPGG